MTETTQASARANQHGHPCPEWCDTDHERPVPVTGSYNDSHQGARTEVEASGDAITLYTRAGVCAYIDKGDKTPIAIVNASYYTPDRARVSSFLLLKASDAHHMAGIVEALADMTPEQLRELAAGICATAETIEGAR